MSSVGLSNITYAHEHMFLDLSSVKKDPDTQLDDFDATLNELKALKEAGSVALWMLLIEVWDDK